MITEQILHDKLYEKFANKLIGGTVYSEIYSTINNLLDEENIVKPNDMSYNQEYSTMTFFLYDKGVRFRIFTIKIKKAKGESHYRYGTSWTDYIIKDFEINLCGSASVEEAIRSGENSIIEYHRSKNNQYRDLEEKVQKIKEALGLETLQQALEICKEISKNSYNLFNNRT